MIKAKIDIDNGVYVNSYITVVKNGEIVREYLTPRAGEYVRYWHGEGIIALENKSL